MTRTQKILNLQTIFNVFISLLFLCIHKDPLQNLIYAVISLVPLLCKKYHSTQILNTIFLPIIFAYNFTHLAYLSAKLAPETTILIYIIYFIGIIFLLLPVIITNFGNIQNNTFRLISFIWLIIVCYYFLNLVPIFPINPISHFALFEITMFISMVNLPIYCLILLKQWGYHFYFNLKIKATSKKYYIWLVVLLVFTCWYTLFNTFSFIATQWNEVFWNWNFSLINPFNAGDTNNRILQNFLKIIIDCTRAGIIEEIERYVYIVLLLAILKKFKYRIIWSALISSTIFAIFHIYLIEIGIMPAILQIIRAFAFGCLLATIFLYTGKIWITVILHFLLDFIVESITDVGLLGNRVFSTYSQLFLKEFIVDIIICTIIIIFILHSKKIKFVVDRLINYDKLINTN